MAFRNLISGTLIRLAVILICFAAILFILFQPWKSQMVITLVILSVSSVLFIISLLKHLLHYAADVAKYLEALRLNDFQLHFNTDSVSKHERELHTAMNQVSSEFRKVKTEHELQYNFIRNIVEIIDIGIIAFNSKGQITLMNTAAAALLGIEEKGTLGQLASRQPLFASAIENYHAGQRTAININCREKELTLVLNIHDSIHNKENIRIVAFQDIKYEIDRQEVEAWVKLLRTLNHEIMNSLTPVSSLAETIKLIICDEEGKLRGKDDLGSESIQDIFNSADIIDRRSKRLNGFINEYRRLTRLPEPKIEYFDLNLLVQSVLSLFNNDISARRINCLTRIAPGESICADYGMIEQVFINLTKNSIEALKNTDKPEIVIEYSFNVGWHKVTIRDNGCGFDESDKNRLFTPFYTTSEQGSGIGLSLSKQIILAHKGSICIDREGAYTIITLKLPSLSPDKNTNLNTYQ